MSQGIGALRRVSGSVGVPTELGRLEECRHLLDISGEHKWRRE